MSSPKDTSSSTAKGYEPQAKKQKTLRLEAARAETYLAPNQPGRVPLNKVSWHPHNRGGQGIIPFHVHNLAHAICTRGTSRRQYNQVRMVEVPEHVVKQWLSANHHKSTLNPLLASFQAMSHTGPLYATLCRTHFVEAHKLILEGGRRFMDQSDGLRFELVNWDCEGRLIQSQGVVATVYSAKLWEDNDALLALMHESNYDESEAFQIVYKARESIFPLSASFAAR